MIPTFIQVEFRAAKRLEVNEIQADPGVLRPVSDAQKLGTPRDGGRATAAPASEGISDEAGYQRGQL